MFVKFICFFSDKRYKKSIKLGKVGRINGINRVSRINRINRINRTKSSKQNIYYMCTLSGIISVVYMLKDRGQNHLFLVIV